MWVGNISTIDKCHPYISPGVHWYFTSDCFTTLIFDSLKKVYIHTIKMSNFYQIPRKWSPQKGIKHTPFIMGI